MTAATVTELSITDLPFNILSGTAEKRRALVAIRYSAAGTGDTIVLSSYIPGIADIEGIVWDSMDSAKTATSATWSTVTLTCAGDAGSHVGEIGLMVNFT